MSRKWEYCSLVSHGVTNDDETHGWVCRITYFTPEGATTKQLKGPERDEPVDVFERAMALLGAAGWELVSLQHQLVADSLHIESAGIETEVPVGYSFSSFGVAYFKRRMKSERAIDQPPIMIPE